MLCPLNIEENKYIKGKCIVQSHNISCGGSLSKIQLLCLETWYNFLRQKLLCVSLPLSSRSFYYLEVQKKIKLIIANKCSSANRVSIHMRFDFCYPYIYKGRPICYHRKVRNTKWYLMRGFAFSLESGGQAGSYNWWSCF